MIKCACFNRRRELGSYAKRNGSYVFEFCYFAEGRIAYGDYEVDIVAGASRIATLIGLRRDEERDEEGVVRYQVLSPCLAEEI